MVSRWQLGTSQMRFDPLDPHYDEPVSYQLAAPTRGELALHPSRVVRFLGNPLPDPTLADAQLWSDSVLQTLYDAIHAVALTAAGSTSLMHEAKVDVVTVPNLSEHLSNAATTAQLSARFSYAAAMKSINNLLLLGDGETWSRQRIDFGGLPEMVRTFLQMAAGAADIPVTRLLGQSPAGLSATGESDTRNYYDMIAARQELDLRPQLERLDALLLRSAGVDPDTVSFSFRQLWQLNAADQAAVALSKAQATQIYAGLGLWPADVTAALARSQLLEDGTYPNAGAVLGEDSSGPPGAGPKWVQSAVADYASDQPRDPVGRWTEGGETFSVGALPGAAFSRANTGFGASSGRWIAVPATIGPEASGIGTPEQEEEEDEEKGQAKARLDPLLGGPKTKIDGTVAMPPLLGGGQSSNVVKPEGIPDHWVEKPSNSDGEMKWTNPDNPNQSVRSMPGNPRSPYPHQQNPYIVHQNGSFRDVNGDPISGEAPRKRPEAHIPSDRFKFKEF